MARDTYHDDQGGRTYEAPDEIGVETQPAPGGRERERERERGRGKERERETEREREGGRERVKFDAVTLFVPGNKTHIAGSDPAYLAHCRDMRDALARPPRCRDMRETLWQGLPGEGSVASVSVSIAAAARPLPQISSGRSGVGACVDITTQKWTYLSATM